ncbi:hypothetical protein HID58_017009 [Brassica napus]|uniref:Uncharacterized protein n=1 Tax=Brassica napus TaxID=3708 RepID=A0ABQ8D671_BRANA|nr:hypothetical protein HID58_017009 [Brassica napus]
MMLKQHRYLQDQQSHRRIKCKRGLKYTYWRSRSQTVTVGTLIEVFLALPCLEGLVLDVGKNVKQSGVALEALNSKEVLIGFLDRSFAVVHFFCHHRIEMLTRGVFRFLVKLREDCYPAPENDMSTEI